MASKKNGKENVVVVVDGEVLEEESTREAPAERGQLRIISPVFSREQLKEVLFKTPPHAIMRRPGKGGKVLSYVKHGYVTDQLNKIFGFDWDLVLDQMSEGKMYTLEIEEGFGGKPPVRHVAVCGHIIVRIRSNGEVVATIKKSGFGSQLWLDTMELGDALKAARSDLLKTCASQLGIALDLYWDDQAEFSAHEKRVQEREQAQREAEQLASEISSGVPTTGVLLIARANSDLSMNIDALQEKLGKSVDEIIAMNAEETQMAWHIISGQK